MYLAKKFAGGVDVRGRGHENFLCCDNSVYANNILAEERSASGPMTADYTQRFS